MKSKALRGITIQIVAMILMSFLLTGCASTGCLVGGLIGGFYGLGLGFGIEALAPGWGVLAATATTVTGMGLGSLVDEAFDDEEEVYEVYDW